jgi:tRNA(Ile)-lysidine synthase
MSLKNLNVIKTRNLASKLSNNRIKNLFKKFEKNFGIKDDFAVAVSGGPDSLALTFLTKIYALKYNLNCKYFIVDHRLRKESTQEAKRVKKTLKNFGIKLEILTWKGKKPLSNIQSLARKKRYELLFFKVQKFKNFKFDYRSSFE